MGRGKAGLWATACVTVMAIAGTAESAATRREGTRGGHVGNGGKVVVCRDDTGDVSSITLYDYYEATVARRVAIDLGPADASVEDQWGVALDRLAALDPLRAAMYRDWARSFADEAVLMTSPLADIPDLEPLMDPPAGCHYEQMVIQQEPMRDTEKRYFINAALFNHPKFSPTQKAGLILHEIIYREAIAFGAQNSVGTRYVNYLVSTPGQKGIQGLSAAEYVKILMAGGFPRAGVNGVWLNLANLKPLFSAEGALRKGFVVDGTALATPFGQVRSRCFVAFTRDGKLEGFSVKPGETVHVDVNGLGLDLVGQTRERGSKCSDPRYDLYDVWMPRGDATSLTGFLARPLDIPFQGGSLALAGRIALKEGHVVAGSAVGPDNQMDVGEGSCTVAPGPLRAASGRVTEIRVKKCRTRVGPNTVTLHGRLGFDGEGRLASAGLAEGHHVLRVGDKDVPALGRGAAASDAPETTSPDLTLHASGAVRSVIVDQDMDLPAASGGLAHVLSGDCVRFTEAGLVEKASPELMRP